MRLTIINSLIAFSSAIFLLNSCSQTESETMPPDTYIVKKAETSIVIDGTGSDPAWENAVLLNDFQFPWLEQAAPSTEFRALYNQEYLFFQFKVVDEDIVLGEDSVDSQAALGSDRVELFFTTNDSINPYYTLEMDPKGRIFSAKARFYRQIDNDWRWPGLEVAGSITEDGYILEGMIPLQSFADLNLWQNAEQKQLACGVFRAEFSHADDGTINHNWISWIQPDSPKPDFHIPSAFGKWVLE
jgi:hypothetical protein